ncbi:DUF5309 domain-containing protein [Sphingomonas japonica]|uniref:Head protein n=1 Tax=Sphingomonas japonica TaxID=511662 RepID=A0ABX0U7T0_9SPHN|nr:DUF5309 domain-containing protein [Sphingomonas japonica]NIJ24828.1 hypothetical protein [Sphingomonas japonica]
MAVPSNTIQTVTRVGNREDLSDIIYNISPTETPFVTAIGRESASAVYHEWQTDALVSANANNFAVQGDDLSNENRPATTRLGNYTQIFTKVVGTSTTQMATKSAGRSNEHSFQLAKAGKEIKRDMEARYTGNYAAVPPAASTAGQSAGALAFMRTNTSRGVGGVNPTLSGTTTGYPNAAATNGTQRAFTEALLKASIASAWNAGGDPTLVIMSLGQKQIAATFTGLAQQRRETGSKRLTIVAGADVYVSDVGELQFVPDRFCSARDALIIDPEMWAIATLDPMQKRKLAVTGLADRDAMYTEQTLVCKNDGASAVIADLT